MASVGIICEYNPFHLGHARQISLIRQQFGQDAAIVCLMSGSFVQRGEPAIFPRLARARTAMVCGADLVLELPALGSLSSAEGFARTGVRFLSPLCDHLCFGTESGTAEGLAATAEAASGVFRSPPHCPFHRHQLPRGEAGSPGANGDEGQPSGQAQ